MQAVGLCHAGREMQGSQSVAGREAGGELLVLGVDTCGPSGTVALARVGAAGVEALGQRELAGRTYSATLVAAVGELLAGAGVKLGDLGAIVVVNGPGSFTGVRVGVSAAKGLAEAGRIPVVAVSRLAVLAEKAGVGSAALDAHRHEVFLRVEEEGEARELLAGVEELAHISSRYGAPGQVAVCDEAAAAMVSAAWSGVELVRSVAPTAADAIGLCAAEILGSHPSRNSLDGAPAVTDLALLDGHYLRRSDAEIFGDAPKTAESRSTGFLVRRMKAGDLERVMELAGSTHHAPGWPRAAYEKALDSESRPRRVALVAEDQDGGVVGFAVASVLPGPAGSGQAGEAELESIVTALPHQRRGVARELFAALKGELRRSGAGEVRLEVREGNHAAQVFYRFLGFREEGRRVRYYADPVEDAVLMKLELK
jgi:tRNA threonylcarbamoyladenosine biosynthesis protein TsaB